MIRNKENNIKPNVSEIIDRSKYNPNEDIFSDKYTTTMPATIRGSDSYFYQLRCNLFSMIKGKGNLHLFVSFSCSEETWPGLHDYLVKFGKAPSKNETIFTANPVLCNHFCYERL